MNPSPNLCNRAEARLSRHRIANHELVNIHCLSSKLRCTSQFLEKIPPAITDTQRPGFRGSCIRKKV
eukprot:gene48573-65151_t